jgi:hypothetical protein
MKLLIHLSVRKPTEELNNPVLTFVRAKTWRG